MYGQRTPEALPFGAGRGLEQLRAFCAPEGEPAGRVATAEDPGENATLWQEVLELELPRVTFNAWLQDTQLLECDGRRFVVGVSSQAARAWLENRLRETVARAIGGAAGVEVDELTSVVRRAAF